MFGCERPAPPSLQPPDHLSALSNWRGRGADGCDERPVFDECVFQLAGERSTRGDDELRQAGAGGEPGQPGEEASAGRGGGKSGRKEEKKRGKIKPRGTPPAREKEPISKAGKRRRRTTALGEYLPAPEIITLCTGGRTVPFFISLRLKQLAQCQRSAPAPLRFRLVRTFSEHNTKKKPKKQKTKKQKRQLMPSEVLRWMQKGCFSIVCECVHFVCFEVPLKRTVDWSHDQSKYSGEFQKNVAIQESVSSIKN